MNESAPAISVASFTQHPEVRKLLDDLRARGVDKRAFSDVRDGAGNQYVDLVQEGGGVLGIALVGYTYVLEQMGIRFFSLAGTSAGAINTLLLAATGETQEAKSEKILDILCKKNLFDLVDGPYAAQKAVKVFLAPFSLGTLGKRILWGTAAALNALMNHGLNPGADFHQWMKTTLRENDIATQADLERKRAQPPGLQVDERAERKNTDTLQPALKIITAEVETETLVEFPQMNTLFWGPDADPNPADYLRSSMSIPVFFTPYRIEIDPRVIAEQKQYVADVEAGKKDCASAWESKASYVGLLPDKSCFVDGGIMSNFPIDAFHTTAHVPRLPTFGVRLSSSRSKPNKAGNWGGFLKSIFNTARHDLDYQFLLKHPDYKYLISRVDTRGFNWLNFFMTDAEKIQLFIRGAKAAAEFLKAFDWEHYKSVRRALLAPALPTDGQAKAFPLETVS